MPAVRRIAHWKASSSIGRAPVSKTGRWGFESLLACQFETEEGMANFIDASVKYIREVRSEMTKVVWPTWPELRGSTILVVVLSAFFAIYVGGVDLVLSVVRRLF